MLTYADVCWRTLKYSAVSEARRSLASSLALARCCASPRRSIAGFAPCRNDTCIRQHAPAYVGIRQHASPAETTLAYVSMRQHTSAYVGIRQHASPAETTLARRCCSLSAAPAYVTAYVSIRLHTSAYEVPAYADVCKRTPLLLSICCTCSQHTSAYVSIRQHTLAYVSIRWEQVQQIESTSSEHTSAYLSIRQHTLLISTRQHTSAYALNQHA
jgi:hypothetical protein